MEVPEQIPFIKYSDSGIPFHFFHANAYHPDCYTTLISEIAKKHSVFGMEGRPFWEVDILNKTRSWDDFADDLINLLEQENMKGIYAGGHSLGGCATLIAAVRRPDLFSRIFLIEPVFLPAYFFWPFYVMPFHWRSSVIPPAKVSKRRTKQWQSKNLAFDHFRRKRVFSAISDEVLGEMIEHATVKNGQGVTLRYSREWETQCYCIVQDMWDFVKKVKVPVTIYRGGKSDAFYERPWKKVKRLRRDFYLFNYPENGHLLPFEIPEKIASSILEHTK